MGGTAKGNLVNKGLILLIEDDENDVFFFQRAAKHVGVENLILVARDGREAVNYLSGKDEFSDRTLHPLPSLVVLDLNLPHRNGLDVLRSLRAQPETHTTLVVVLTSSAAPQDMHEAYAVGANSYLIKPTNPEHLGEHLQLIKSYWLGLNQTPPADGNKHFGPALEK
ncbi:MAG TPA: response regulator [Methylomirabilota bacterium]|nr:response regulator [Methylomirabilota bacterium]